MTQQDWSDMLTILTKIEAAIQSANYSLTKHFMLQAREIGQKRYDALEVSREKSDGGREGRVAIVRSLVEDIIEASNLSPDETSTYAAERIDAYYLSMRTEPKGCPTPGACSCEQIASHPTSKEPVK